MAKIFRGVIGWGVAIVAIIVVQTFPQAVSRWAGLFFLSWVAGWFSYIQFIESKESGTDLYKKATLICVFFGVWAGLHHGYKAPYGGDSELVELFPTTFDSKAGEGVRVFLAVTVGSFVGIYLTDLTKKRRI